jgi:electron-transferring-flavoprotein dehydrogenase
MAMAGFTGGALSWPGRPLPPHQRLPRMEEYYRGKITPEEIEEARKASAAGTQSLHDALMDKAGWPPVELDGKLLVSHQDALLMGGKVQAAAGFADHVVVLNPELCRHCGKKVCITMCSGQALTPGEEGAPAFDREKCIHCGACLWNCMEVFESLTGQTNLAFRAGAGGLHSAEN